MPDYSNEGAEQLPMIYRTRVWRLADIVKFAGIDPATVPGLTR